VQDRLGLPGVQRFSVVDLPAVGGNLPDGIFRGGVLYLPGCAGGAGAGIAGIAPPGPWGIPGGTPCGRTGPGIDGPGIPPFMIVGEDLPPAT